MKVIYNLTKKEKQRLDKVAKRISKVGIKLSEAAKSMTLFSKAFPNLYDMIYRKK